MRKVEIFIVVILTFIVSTHCHAEAEDIMDMIIGDISSKRSFL